MTSLRRALLLSLFFFVIATACFPSGESTKERKEDKASLEADQVQPFITLETGNCPAKPEECYFRALAVTEAPQFGAAELREVLTLFEAACEASFALACYDRAVLADEGLEGPGQREVALEFYRKACEAGHDPGCARTTLLSSTAPTEGPAQWKEACEGGELFFCIQMGLYLSENDSIEEPEESAKHYFQRSCTEDHREGCYWLARYYDQLPQGYDNQEIEGLYAKACQGDVARSCSALGRRLDARDAPKDELEPVLARACALGDGNGCFHRGSFHHNRGEVEQAIQGWESGCDLWNAASCHRLGQLLLREEERSPLHSFQRACQLGLPEACFNQAVYLNTTQSPPPFEQTRPLLERACTGEHLQSCAFLASMLRNGQGGPKDPERAQSLSRQACEGGVKMACTLTPQGL